MRKQQNPYTIRLLLLASGERFPLIVDRATGVPLYKPTLYALTRLRATNQASATIYQHCLAIMVLTLFLRAKEIDLDERMASGRLLSLPEVESLVRFCRMRMDDVLKHETNPKPTRSSNVASLERARMRRTSKLPPKELASESSATRGTYIAKYLEWLVGLCATDPVVRPHPNLAVASTIVIGQLREHLPSKNRHSVSARKGFSRKTRERILEVVAPDCEENPWHGRHCKLRNELIIRWLLHLGIRRGEFLGIQISDIDFQRNTVTIARRADDNSDPRLDEPNTKTYSRLLPLADEVALLARNYILKSRSQIKGARKHNFLLVSDGTGMPLGKAAFAKIFRELQAKLPAGVKVHPHLFRHTWNDDFSEKMDREKVPEDRERKYRSTLMGWSPTSETAATYTKRHVERKAREASLAMQKDLMKGKSE